MYAGKSDHEYTWQRINELETEVRGLRAKVDNLALLAVEIKILLNQMKDAMSSSPWPKESLS